MPRNKFKPLNTVDFSKIGLGDNLMAFAGLYALLDNGFEILNKDANLYVHPFVADIARAIFAPFSFQIRPVDFDHRTELISPYLTPAAPRGVRQRIGTFLGHDWALNWAQAIDLIKTGNPEPWERLKTSKKLKLAMVEYLVHGRRDWRLAAPEYIGIRIWGPVALRLGIHRAELLNFHKRSLGKIRAVVNSLAAPRTQSGPAAVIYPSGKSFQAVPPFFCEKIEGFLSAHGISSDRVMYVSAKDPWIDGYRQSGLPIEPFEPLPSTIATLRDAKVIICADSFVSHLAQFIRDDFIVFLNRDFRENVIHPGACPIIIQEHPICALCDYPAREFYRVCPSNSDHCSAFDNEALLKRCDEFVGFLASRKQI